MPRGEEIEVTRELEFEASKLRAMIPAGLVERQMDSDSGDASERLKALIERMGTNE